MVIVLVVYLTVTLGVIAAYQGYAWFVHRDARLVRQRIAQTFGKNQQSDAQVALFGSLQKLDLELSASDPKTGDELVKINRSPWTWQHVNALVEQARLPFTARQFSLLCLGFGLSFSIVGGWFGGPIIFVAAALLGGTTPFFLARARRTARRDKLLKQLPNAFDLMARVIRAGQSIPQALMSVAETFDEPIASEFASCHQQQNLGLTPEVTFQEMVQRSGILELRIFAMSMMIQRQTGGNLSEILERLASLIRSRLRLRQQVRAWTAEGRLQGWTLVALPFFMFGVLMCINRPYVSVLFNHVSLLVGTLALMGVGIWWIRRIVSFDY